MSTSTNPLTISNGEAVSAEEHAALTKLKLADISQGLDDKFLMIFLLARKLNVERTVELLTKHITWKNECGFDKPIRPDELKISPVENDFIRYIPGKYDKKGRAVVYLKPAKFPKPGELEVEDHFKISLYYFERGLEQPLEWHRKGIT